MDWRITRIAPDGTAGATYSTATPGGITEFGWNTTPGNTCLEGFITAVPSENDLQPRDVVRISTSVDGATWRIHYTGIITTAGDQHGTEPVEYTLRPLDIRLHEILLEEAKIAGGDVADMVKTALGSITLPTGVFGYRAPTLNFEMGDRYPGFETVADFLDAMRDATGAFIVPAGSSYSYDGRIYNPGEVVPATLWGVAPQDPDPFLASYQLVFRRPQGSVLSLDVRTDPITVEWDRISGDRVFDRATLIYGGTEYPDGANLLDAASVAVEPVGYPIARSFGSGDYEAAKRIQLEYPLDFMTQVSLSPSVTSGTINNLANVTDGNDATFADANFDGGTTTQVRIDLPHTEGILTLRLAPSGEGIVYLSTGSASPDDAIVIRVFWRDSGAATLAYLRMRIDPSTQTIDDAGLITIPVIVPRGVDPASVDSVRLLVDLSEDSRIYEIEYFVPDVDVGGDSSEQLAEGHYQDPAPAGGRVILHEPLHPASAARSAIDLTLADGSTVNLPVERIEYGMTRETGFVATYHIGSSRDPDLIAERVVLERIAERAS